MLKKTLLAILCSTALVACGGGSSNDSGSNGGTNNNGGSTASDLDKAKQLVTTTNNIIAYFQNFENLNKTYKATFDAVGNTGSDVGNATGLALNLASLAFQDAKGATKTYNAAQLQDLLEEDDNIDYELSDNTLKIETTASSVTISGSAKVKYWVGGYWDSSANKWHNTFGDGSTVKVTALKLSGPFTSSAKDYTFTIANGGKITTKNADNQEASFSFKSDSTASVTNYATAKIVSQRNDTEVPEKAEFKLSNLEFASNKSVLTLTEFSSEAKRVTIKDGAETKPTLIPVKVTLKGEAKVEGGSDNLALDASIKLNNALTGTIDVTNGETATSFINADLNVKISGNLKDAKAVNKPFSVNLNTKRSEYQKGNANIDVTVGTDKLTVAATTSDLIGTDPKAAHEPTVSAKISHANGAYVDIPNVEKFTSAAIKVGTTTYGTIHKVSQSLYNATFNDKTTVTIAP